MLFKKRSNIILILFIITIFGCAHLNNARKAYESKDYKQVIALCRKTIASDSTNVEAWVLLTQSYLATDSLSLALTIIKKAYQLNPASPDIVPVYTSTLIGLGDQAYDDKKFRDAMAYFEAAESLDSTHAIVLDRIGNLHFENGDFDKARIKFEKRLTLSPDSTVSARLAEIGEKTQDAESLYQKGLSAYKRGQLKTARNYFDKALKVKSDHTDARYHLLMADGRLYYKKATKKSCWDAVDAFGKAATLRSDEAEPYFRMAQAYERKDPDEFVNAIDAYESALARDPQGSYSAECRKRIKALKARKEKMDKFWGRKR